MMTKVDVLRCLDEIGHRVVRDGSADDVNHFLSLGVAFGVAYLCVQRRSDEEIEMLAAIIQQLGLEGGHLAS